MSHALTPDHLREINQRLIATDQMLETSYPGELATRQPIHTVYIPAHAFDADSVAQWGETALASAAAAGGLTAVASGLADALKLAVDPDLDPEQLALLVEAKLRRKPIEDLRIDFEDGFGMHSDEVEDAAIDRAVWAIGAMLERGTLPPHVGIRMKCLEAPTRARALRTLDRFIAGLVDTCGIPGGLELTVPKVTTVAQVEATVRVLEILEAAHGLPAGQLRFEVQVETPQVIIGPDGTTPLASLIHAGQGRVSSLHYGTYDYSASLGVAGAYQSLEHPVADVAKSIMQVAVAGTGVRMSDGSTNVLPVGPVEQQMAAWTLHARLVRRSLERAIYQGWDMHPNHLPTRYLASYAFFRTGLAGICQRLSNYVHRIESAVLDEPATARAMAAFLMRGVHCGAVPESEVAQRVGLSSAELTALAYPTRAATTPKEDTCHIHD